ncbi:glycosyltransferase family 4 protein [Pontibacter sp. KCTC 32443]|uniref:glycosyltransferase family 4 protein n=1 Tax=Pontibacter TaxID=323449 RepID=UPI00164EADFA|nr:MULTISPECIES: glycosyltransferase family 4 protein [Pontibacter]MBC5772964.1 glycosyltransferase family 4 protein [Pontibacter sp. KCTC 32443]
MRILLVHNHYKQSAGEDTVFFAEAALLESHGHIVEKLTLTNNDVNSVTEKLEAALGVIYNSKSARIVEEKILTYKPDIIHVHNFFPLISPAVFYVAQKHHVPVVMTLHNYRLLCPSAYLHYNDRLHLENIHKTFPVQAILDKAYRNSYFQTTSVVLTTGIHKLLGTWQTKVDRYITLTQGGTEMFRNSSLRLRPEQLVVKPNFTTDLGEGAAEREDYFLFVGRLSPEKGVETMLKANAAFPFKLKIIGDGPLREAVEAHAATHPNVEYLGYQKRPRVEEELKKAKALIFPSEWPEMFGMSIIEAFSTGTPVIATNMGGAAYLVKHNQNGLLYTPQQAAELVKQVQLLNQNKELAAALGREARQEYLDKYTAEVNYQQLLDIYTDVIRKKMKPTSAITSADFEFYKN